MEPLPGPAPVPCQIVRGRVFPVVRFRDFVRLPGQLVRAVEFGCFRCQRNTAQQQAGADQLQCWEGRILYRNSDMLTLLTPLMIGKSNHLCVKLFKILLSNKLNVKRYWVVLGKVAVTYTVPAGSPLIAGISSGKRRKYIHGRFRHPASCDTDTSMYGVGSSRHPCLLRFLKIHPQSVTWLVNLTKS